MASSLLNIGVQALTSNQTALSYTGQNIANVNTEGYSRQRVNFATQEPPILGVKINDIERITSEYLAQQIRKDQSALAASEQLAGKISLLDGLMVSDSTSISASMDNFFTSLQSTVDDPLFIANRELFLAEAQSTVETFRNFDQRLRDQQKLMDTEIRSMTSDVNALLNSIGSLNTQISSMAAGNQNYNALLDEREILIKDLSSYISVDVMSSDGGVTTSITLSNGEPLVVAGRAAQLSMRDGNPDPAQVEIVLSRGAVNTEVTDYLGAGGLGGLFNYRDEVLQPVIKEIGRMAIVFSTAMNDQHRAGMDLNGDMGKDLFTPQKTGLVSASVDNQVKASSTDLRFYDVSELNASDYEFRMTGIDSFQVTRLSDGAVFNSSTMNRLDDNNADATLLEASETFQWQQTSGPPASTKLKLSLDGFTLTISGDQAPRAGDTYLLQPTQNGARSLDLEITNPRMLALASPVRVTPATTNTGNLEITDIQVLNVSDSSALRTSKLNPPLEIVFNANGEYSVYTLEDPSNPQPYLLDGVTLENQTYTSGQPIDLGDFSVTLRNSPNPGDRLTIEYNTEGFSDSRNALAMSNLQQQALVDGYSLQDAYGQLLAKVGTQASNAQTALSADKAVLDSSESALQSISGVNLDEEAAKLVQYQQAYTASTRLITAYQTIFDSLIAAIR